MQPKSQLTFLGSSDSQGVPRWWCNCEVCVEARDSGLNARTRPSVLLKSESANILIDASPEFRIQVTRENVSQPSKLDPNNSRHIDRNPFLRSIPQDALQLDTADQTENLVQCALLYLDS